VDQCKPLAGGAGAGGRRGGGSRAGAGDGGGGESLGGCSAAAAVEAQLARRVLAFPRTTNAFWVGPARYCPPPHPTLVSCLKWFDTTLFWGVGKWGFGFA